MPRLPRFVFCALALCLVLGSSRISSAWTGLEWRISTASAVAAGSDPLGACCRIDNVCVDGVTYSQCFQVGGWHAVGTTCLANACGPGGACCVNGTCTFGQSRGYCEGAAFGRWYPTCGDPECNPVGACCVNGQCSQQTENLCFLNGGYFVGAGIACGADTCRGACCLPNLGGCAIKSEPECNILEGAFNGVGSTCNGFVCTGACCLGGGFCQELSEYDCFQTEGVFLGGPCKSVQCVAPTGACCFDNAVCNDDYTEGNCVEFGGAYAGNNTTCASQPCSATGACCLDFGGGFTFCSDPTFEDHCINIGGTFAGIGTTCASGVCTPGPVGACCFFGSGGGGGCQDHYTAEACASQKALYKGDNTTCTTGICCPADFNNDGSVNTPDLTYFLGRFGRSFPPPGSERADLVPDGSVNTADLTRFLGAFGRSCPY